MGVFPLTVIVCEKSERFGGKMGQIPFSPWRQGKVLGFLRVVDLLGFFDSVHMGRCKIPPAMNDPDDVYLLRFDLVENPV